MPKQGKEKNTQNKAKHTKLMNQKIKKVKARKENTKAKLKAIVQRAKEAKKIDD